MTRHDFDIGFTWFVIGMFVADMYRTWWPKWMKKLADRKSGPAGEAE